MNYYIIWKEFINILNDYFSISLDWIRLMLWINKSVIKYGARYPMPYQNYIPRELYSSSEELLKFNDNNKNIVS